MATPLQVLIAEDRANDAELMVQELRRAGYDVDWQRVDTEREFRLRLTPRLQLILADYHMPSFDAPAAIRILQESKLDIPLIVVSGSLGDDQAVEFVKQGATDYILKDRLARLGMAARRALEERRVRAERSRLEDLVKQNDEQMRGILSTVEDVVWSLSLTDGKLLYINPAGEKMFGRPVADFFQDAQLWLDSVHPDDRKRAADSQQSMIRWGTGEVTFRILRPDGSFRHVHTRAWCAYDAAGKPTRLEGINTDITERMNREVTQKELEESQRNAERLKELNDFKTQFINMMAHELNNPLTPMKIQLHLLKGGNGKTMDPAQLKAMDVLGRSVDRLSAFLEDLLDAARLQSGQIRLERSKFDVLGVLRSAVATYEGQPDSPKVSLASAAQPEIQVSADQRRIEQVVNNLLSNAIKFTPSQGTVELRAEERNGEIVICVSDTGRGLAPEEIPKLFQPFGQLEGAKQGKHTGTGLGLFICKGIMSQHGGRMWCESQGLGRGSRFYAAVPLTPPAPSA
jgi:PAS domain S-box-containing protein